MFESRVGVIGFYLMKFALDTRENRLEGMGLLGRRYIKKQLIIQCDKVCVRFDSCAVISEEEHLN